MRIKKIIPIVLIAAYALMLSSCEQDVNIAIPKNKTKLVINSGVNPDSTLKVYIGRTVKLFDKTTTKEVNYAVVSIKSDDGAIILQGQGNGIYTSPVKPQIGKKYSIEANEDGMAIATSICIVPPRPQIEDLTLNEVESSGQKVTQVELLIDDPSETEDYYIIEMRRPIDTPYPLTSKTFSYYYLSTRDIFCENVNKEESNYQLLFRDISFNGKKKKIIFTTESRITTSNNIECVIKRCSKDFWEYKRTLDLYEAKLDSPFSQSVQVYTNVVNGVGIFGAYSSTVSKIDDNNQNPI